MRSAPGKILDFAAVFERNRSSPQLPITHDLGCMLHDFVQCILVLQLKQ